MIGMNVEEEKQLIPIEEFLKVATSEQNKLLLDLYELAIRETNLVKKIDNVYNAINDGIYQEGYAKGITLCESEDDANVISLKLKIELRDVQDNIKRLLKRAVDELDMGNVGIIRRQYKNYVL